MEIVRTKDVNFINKIQRERNFKEIKSIPEDWCVLVAMDGVTFLGLIVIFYYRRLPHSDYSSGNIAELGGLYVRQQYRGNGVAHELVRKAVEIAKSSHLDALVADANANSYSACVSAGAKHSSEKRLWWNFS